MKIVFHGATRTVTGSQHEVQVAGKRILLDCGFFQGQREQARQINSHFDFDPKTVAAVVLSHGHADHCANLPNLVRQGFRGPIYCTKATAAISALMLMDSAKIQEEDAAYLNQKTVKTWQGQIQPLYTRDDAAATIKLFQSIEYRQPRDLGGFTVELRDAGHVLGSAAIKVTEAAAGTGGRNPSLVFTGDVGRPNSPVLNDADPFDQADVLISECTYGGRTHSPVTQVPDELAGIIGETVERGGWVIMPAFALGRTQTLVYELHQLRQAKKIPGWLPIYVDSPLASHLTDIFRQFPNLWDAQTKHLIQPFDFPNLTYVASVSESMALNARRGPGIIIASSGMCEAGRILHHLKHHIRNREDTVLLPGYQAENTLGRKLQDKWREVPILGDMIPLNAQVRQMDALSAHGDGKELLDYVMPLRGAAAQAGSGAAAKPPRVYLVHGEMPQAQAHQRDLSAAGFAAVEIPQRGDQAEV